MRISEKGDSYTPPRVYEFHFNAHVRQRISFASSKARSFKFMRMLCGRLTALDGLATARDEFAMRLSQSTNRTEAATRTVCVTATTLIGSPPLGPAANKVACGEKKKGPGKV